MGYFITILNLKVINIQLPTGKTINVSAYEYFFVLKDDDVHFFYQECIADDLGTNIENPFSNLRKGERIELEHDEKEQDID